MLLCLMLLGLPAHANLGETIQQCEARYGPATPVHSGQDIKFYAFHKDGSSHYVGFINNLEVIDYVSQNKKADQLTSAEIETFILAESDKGPFVLTSDKKWLKSWEKEWQRTKPDNAYIHYDSSDGVLIISNQSFSNHLKNLQQTNPHPNQGS